MTGTTNGAALVDLLREWLVDQMVDDAEERGVVDSNVTLLPSDVLAFLDGYGDGHAPRMRWYEDGCNQFYSTRYTTDGRRKRGLCDQCGAVTSSTRDPRPDRCEACPERRGR